MAAPRPGERVKTVTARTWIDGLHHWPDAPDRRAYLRHPHRHLFHLTATVRVDGDHREVEFHDLGDELYDLARARSMPYHPDAELRDFGTLSCEAIASALARALSQRGYRPVEVTVSEDGENDASWHQEDP